MDFTVIETTACLARIRDQARTPIPDADGATLGKAERDDPDAIDNVIVAASFADNPWSALRLCLEFQEPGSFGTFLTGLGESTTPKDFLTDMAHEYFKWVGIDPDFRSAVAIAAMQAIITCSIDLSDELNPRELRNRLRSINPQLESAFSDFIDLSTLEVFWLLVELYGREGPRSRPCLGRALYFVGLEVEKVWRELLPGEGEETQ